jgi:hypothetical protein
MKTAYLELQHDGKTWTLRILTVDANEAIISITDAKANELKNINIPIYSAD